MTDEVVVAPAAPAPAAPVLPAVSAPVPAVTEPVVKPAPAAEAIQYEATGDPGLDYALGFIAKAGIDDQHPALIAASNGDFGLLKAFLAEKGIAGWEQAIALGEKAYEGLAAKASAEAAQIGESVVQVAAGLGVDWEDAVVHAREHGTDEEIAAINDALKNPATAKMAALWVTYNYANAAGTTVAPAKSAVKPEAAPTGLPGGQAPLTRVEFSNEVGKLHKRMGDAYTASPEYRALAARLQR